MVFAYIFSFKKCMLLCIVYYYSKFPIVRKPDSLTVNDRVKAAKIVFAKFKLTMKIISDTGINFTSDTFKQFCRQMNIEQAITLLFHHQSNRQVEACIKFVKCTITNALIIILSI